MTIISLADERSRRQRSAPRAQTAIATDDDWVARVVVVAGDRDWQAAFRVFLWNQPYQADVIAPPDEWSGITILNPDVVVLDLDVAPTHLLRHAYKMKRSVLGRFVPVIGIGANTTHESRLHAFAAGVDQWLSKPMSCEEMRLAVLTALRARQNYRALLGRA